MVSGLTALFRADARIRARRIYKSHHGNIEFLGGLHQAQRFTVALGRGIPKLRRIFFGVTAF